MLVSRFAPSITGEAHPGTLLSALLVWLDARSRHGTAMLRIEDIDRTRVAPAWTEQMIEALAWFGLDWDAVVIQSSRTARHEAALDQLAAAGRLYPCSCSRTDRSGGRRAPDGGWAYPNTCRTRELPPGGWRAAGEVALRARLPDDRVLLVDDNKLDLSQTPAYDMGDPIVRRRDGAIAYHLAVVVDDARAGIARIVRGRDIATSTATHVALQRLLGLPTPVYRHHFLFLEEAGGKLAKLHGSVGWKELSSAYSGAELCGRLAHLARLAPGDAPLRPRELVTSFSWSRVRAADLALRWDGIRLAVVK